MHDPWFKAPRGGFSRRTRRWVGVALTALVLGIVALSRMPLGSWAGSLDPRRLVIPLDPEQGELPIESASLARARSLLPDRFVQHETARFVALSDGSAAWTRSQLERFERAHDQFQRFARRIGLPTPKLRHRLVAILFAQHSDYAEFAARVDGVTDRWAKGYYLAGEDRMVCFDPDTDPDAVAARGRLEAQRQQIEAADAALAEQRRTSGRVDPNVRAAVDRAHRQQGLGEEQIVLGIRRQVISTVIHEALHQLLFHTGVQNPRVQSPFWIAEGLAASFETEQPAAAFGPDFDNPTRRQDFERLLMEDRLIPLESFVAFERLPDRREATARVFYSQSVALLCYLFRQRPTELRTYLLTLAAEPPGRPGPMRQQQIFREAFGDVAALERSWLRHELAGIASEHADARRTELEGAVLEIPAPRLIVPASGLLGDRSPERDLLGEDLAGGEEVSPGSEARTSPAGSA